MEIWTFDEGILLDENCQAIACTWECEAATERNIRLMTSAPEMYELLQWLAYGDCDNCVLLMDRARKLLARIDGEVDINVVKNKS